MTYVELLQRVRDYTEVDSAVLTDTIVQGMIRDAELRIFREVDADYTREYATANLNIGSPYLDLPSAATTTATIIPTVIIGLETTSSTTTGEVSTIVDASGFATGILTALVITYLTSFYVLVYGLCPIL